MWVSLWWYREIWFLIKIREFIDLFKGVVCEFIIEVYFYVCKSRKFLSMYMVLYVNDWILNFNLNLVI